MRLIHINSTYNKGSTGKIVFDIHNLLKEQKIPSKVFYGRFKKSDDDDKSIHFFGGKVNNFFHFFLSRFFDLHGRGSIFYTYSLIKKIKKFKPDIIHLHNIHGYYLNYPILFDFLNLSKIKTVWTFHDAWPFTGHCAYFDFSNCNKWKTQCSKCPELKSYPKSLGIDNSYHNYNLKKIKFTSLDSDQLTIVSPSKWLKENINLSFLSKFKSIVINNGINLSVFKPTLSSFRTKYNLKNSFLILGVAKPWTRRKGLNFFIELSRLVPNNFKIILVGLDVKQIRDIPSTILSIPTITNSKELAEIYSSVDVFINPTLEDNFPTTNLESLACGTPVITFDTGGCGEVVNKSNGLVLKNKNTEDLYLAIKEISNKPKAFYKENCIKTIEDNFDKNIRYLDYLNLYKDILNK
jgi:putative colanic acid biosynthesis glycosyltransferase